MWTGSYGVKDGGRIETGVKDGPNWAVFRVVTKHTSQLWVIGSKLKSRMEAVMVLLSMFICGLKKSSKFKNKLCSQTPYDPILEERLGTCWIICYGFINSSMVRLRMSGAISDSIGIWWSAASIFMPLEFWLLVLNNYGHYFSSIKFEFSIEVTERK